MKRGEVRWYKFTKPDKKRPVVILTRNSIIEFLGEVTVAPITSVIRNIPSEVFLSINDGMPKNCAINLDHIQTVSKSKIGSLIATLSSEKMSELRSAILFALGFKMNYKNL
ncbi:MAG: type II toxin-antitoxin system PemK/MazF family toxin [Actinobacteria bacterium]|nr:MAG: type II toxin-antitoxin system PemK/MazF family toxin [Actinomycetota bacterium]